MGFHPYSSISDEDKKHAFISFRFILFTALTLRILISVVRTLWLGFQETNLSVWGHWLDCVVLCLSVFVLTVSACHTLVTREGRSTWWWWSRWMMGCVCVCVCVCDMESAAPEFGMLKWQSVLQSSASCDSIYVPIYLYLNYISFCNLTILL